MKRRYNIKMPGKTSLRDKLDEDVLDLSLMQMSEVPVTEIVSTVKTLENYLELIFKDVKRMFNYFSFQSNVDFNFLGSIAKRYNTRFVQ